MKSYEKLTCARWRECACVHPSQGTTMKMRIPERSLIHVVILLTICAAGGLSAAGIPPQILVEPSSRTVQAGDSVVFRVYQTGGSVRWFRNSSEIIEGAFGDSVVLHNVQLGDDKSRIQCLVSNEFGVRNCSSVLLNVLRPTREMLTFTGKLSERTNSIAVSSERGIDMQLDIYRGIEGGLPLYTELFSIEEGRGVAILDGKFVLRAGTGRVTKGALSELIQEASPTYAQFSVGIGEDREILLPRVPMTAMPYALAAGNDLLKGAGSPLVLGIEAPVGTRFIDTQTGKKWLRGVRSWVSEP